MNWYSTYVQEVKECTLSISFAVKGSLDERLFWKDRIHTNKRTNKRSLQQLAFDFIKDIRICRFLNQ